MKSVCAYEGFDEKELSFPTGVIIRLLRAQIATGRKDSEEWCEGKLELYFEL